MSPHVEHLLLKTPVRQLRLVDPAVTTVTKTSIQTANTAPAFRKIYQANRKYFLSQYIYNPLIFYFCMFFVIFLASYGNIIIGSFVSVHKVEVEIFLFYSLGLFRTNNVKSVNWLIQCKNKIGRCNGAYP